MTRITRRQFFEESMIATAIAVAAGSNGPRAQAQETRRASANETIRHAVIGCRIRGRVHAAEFGRQAGVEVAYVCDPDRQLADELAASVEKARAAGRRRSRTCAIFDDKSVDTVFDRRAEPLARARRDLGHAGGQGRLRREAGQPQRRRGAADRAGGGEDRPDLPGGDAEPLQRRPGRGRRVHPRREARRRDARAQHRLRPAREHRRPAGRTRCPGRWITTSSWGRPPTSRSRARTSITTGTGSGTPATASWGTTTSTIVDICRWLMGLTGLGDSVLSFGGRLGYEDAGETPNTQVVVHTFGRPRSCRRSGG